MLNALVAAMTAAVCLCLVISISHTCKCCCPMRCHSLCHSLQHIDTCFNTTSPVLQPIPGDPRLVTGQLDNGFRYVLLPNKLPPQRFEAHLEVHAGSVDERPDEQASTFPCTHANSTSIALQLHWLPTHNTHMHSASTQRLLCMHVQFSKPGTSALCMA